MSFLSPLFLAAAIVVPILVHLIQRERNNVVNFPSLMFLRKIPYQSVQRRRIRHWFLLALRALAIALIVAAFARPFFSSGAAAVAAAGGNREVVILLDQSASMAYGDHWDRARAAAHDAVASLGAGDRGTLVLFGRNAEEHVRSTTDKGRLDSAIDAAKPTSGATRYGSALKLAEGAMTRSTLPRREAIVISDFQKSGWTGAEDVKFGEGVTVTTVPIRGEKDSNLAVPSVAFARAPFSGQERVTITAGVANKGLDPVQNVAVSLEIDGRQMESKTVSVAANASASVTFAPFTLAAPGVSGAIKAGTDPMPADNTFSFVLEPSAPVSVLVVDGSERGTASFFLTKALEIGTSPVVPVGNHAGRARVRRRARRRRTSSSSTTRCCRRGCRPRRWRASSRAAAASWWSSAIAARGRPTTPRSCRARSARRSTAAPDEGARSASSTTAIRRWRSSRRRAAATSPRRTSSVTRRSRPRRPTGCSRGSTMGRWPSWSGGSAPGA